MRQHAKTTTTTPPEIPTIATHQQLVRMQQHWRTVCLVVGVMQAYALCYAWLPHLLRVPMVWLVIMPASLPSVVLVALGCWWQPWERPPTTDPFVHIPQPEEHVR